MQHFILSLLLVFSIQSAFSQNIYSSDGHDMGPRGYFIEACAGDSLIEIDPYQGYSSISFCNCLADDLLPLLTKIDINYYITGSRQSQLMGNPTYANIINECMLAAQKNWIKPPPPPEETRKNVARSSNDTVLINEILILVDYESKFYQILEDQLRVLGKDSSVKPKKIEAIRTKIKYDVINQPVIVNTYKEFASEDLQMIYEYFEPMTSEELTNSGVRYEQHILDYFSGKIGILIKDELNLE